MSENTRGVWAQELLLPDFLWLELTWYGGLLIHVSLVRVQPGEPVFSMCFHILTTTTFSLRLEYA